VSDKVSYEQFLKNLKRARLTRAGLLKIIRENEQREAKERPGGQSSSSATLEA